MSDEARNPASQAKRSADTGESIMKNAQSELPRMLDPAATVEAVQRYVEAERNRTRRILLWASGIFVFTALVILVVFVTIGIFVLRNSMTATQRADHALDQTARYMTEVAGISVRIAGVESGNKEIQKRIEKGEAIISQRNRNLKVDLVAFQKWVEDNNAKSRTAVVSMESKIGELEGKIGEKESELAALHEQYRAAISTAMVRAASPEPVVAATPAVAANPAVLIPAAEDQGDAIPASAAGVEDKTAVDMFADVAIGEIEEPEPPEVRGHIVEVSFPDGDRYKGEFKDGLFHGWGIYTYRNGDRYEGEFRDNMKNGKGTLVYRDGDKYVGEFKDDMRHGKGTMLFAKGDKYSGLFKNDAVTGSGRMDYQNGNKYAGMFRNGIKSGTGVLRFPNGDEYSGDFRDDARDGKGVYVFSNGEKYIGDFSNGQRHGKGRYIYVGGEEYVGDFRDGKKDGKGVCVYPNGVRVNVVWKDDELVEEEQRK